MQAATRRRVLLPDSAPSAPVLPRPSFNRLPQPLPALNAMLDPNECGRLVTRTSTEGTHSQLPRCTSSLIPHSLTHTPRAVLSIRTDRSFFIGRSEDCDYTIPHPAVSSKHCRLYALVVDTGEILVCLEDTSTNGTLYNQRRVSRATRILSDGDCIESVLVSKWTWHASGG